MTPPGPVARLLPDLPGGELTDGVVTLRPLTPDDAAFHATLASLPDVVATSVPPQAPDPEEVARRCVRSAARWLAGERVRPGHHRRADRCRRWARSGCTTRSRRPGRP